MQPYFRTSNFSETFLISVPQWSLKVPAKNARTQYSTISSLLLESQTERRYQSPNMHLDTMAEETICKPYLRIFQNTADQWQSGASSRGILSIHVIFHLIILPILTFEWLWFHLQGTAGKEGYEIGKEQAHISISGSGHACWSYKTIADSEEKGNSNQNTIHHQKKYYYYTSQSLLQGPVKAFFSIVTSSPAKYSLSVCVQAKKQCLNQNILVLAYNYKQNAITVQYNIFL